VNDERTRSGNAIGAFSAWLTGILTSIFLVALCHAAHLASTPRERGYVLTQYLSTCASGFFILVFALAGALLGFLDFRRTPVALGMMSPLPLALIVEVFQDPTSHNLLPFEVGMFWAPAFLLAFFGATLGARLRAARTERDEN
jgi:hypothetical protein